jgi:hypothetical protein
MVVPSTKEVDDDATPEYPPQIQETLESAVLRRKATIQTQITDFTAEKRQEFKSWRDQARKQAKIIATVASSSSKPPPPSPIPNTALVMPATRPVTSPNKELFQKSPLSSYSHPGASPLAAASLTRSYSEQKPLPPSPPLHKITPPPIPLSSSLKSPGNHSFGKPVKRVMFQDPPDDTAQSDIEEEIQETPIPTLPPSSATISVDGIFHPLSSILICLLDELFDFDETIPSVAIDPQIPLSNPISPSSQPVKSPLFAPPLSPFRRRSIEKYTLPDEEEYEDDEDLFDGAVATEPSPPEISSSYSKPIAITPPSRSFLADGLGVDEDDEDGGMKGLIERISLKNNQTKGKKRFSEQRMLWDIPGDFYRSVPS